MKIEGPASVGIIDGAGKKGISQGSKEAQLNADIPNGSERQSTCHRHGGRKPARSPWKSRLQATTNRHPNLDVPVLPGSPGEKEENIGRDRLA
ncbi:MAG: hypothetical protein R3B51_09685 [Thermodesulfobacteriota bacterium]